MSGAAWDWTLRGAMLFNDVCEVRDNMRSGREDCVAGNENRSAMQSLAHSMARAFAFFHPNRVQIGNPGKSLWLGPYN